MVWDYEPVHFPWARRRQAILLGAFGSQLPIGFGLFEQLPSKHGVGFAGGQILQLHRTLKILRQQLHSAAPSSRDSKMMPEGFTFVSPRQKTKPQPGGRELELSRGSSSCERVARKADH
jgi:hypothetical protein